MRARSAAPVAGEPKPRTIVLTTRTTAVRAHTAAAARRTPCPNDCSPRAITGRTRAVAGSVRSSSTSSAGAATGAGGSSRTETDVIVGAGATSDDRSRHRWSCGRPPARLGNDSAELGSRALEPRSAAPPVPPVRERLLLLDRAHDRGHDQSAVELPERVLDTLGNEQLRHAALFAHATRCPAGKAPVRPSGTRRTPAARASRGSRPSRPAPRP